MSAEAVALPEVGDIVGEGRFELRSKLGEGGMGTVFLARDRLLDAELALKLLIPRYVGRPEREQRLANEAEYLRRLQGHPQIVQFVDAGRLRDRNGWPWMSTEVMRGQTLDWLIIHRSLDTARKLEIARQLAEALHACHQAGVVHRDVNPGNVYVLEDGSIKLFDFSHAADLRGPKLAVGAAERLTRVFETPGTVGYIGPEQAANAAPDPSMDVFGFGVLLYELVSNSNPFSQYKDRDAFIDAQCRGSLETPRLQAWAYDAPEELAELVHDCMQRGGAERPSMQEILARLEAIGVNMGRRDDDELNATVPRLRASERVEVPPAANDEVTEAVDAPAIIGVNRRRELTGDWTTGRGDVQVLCREMQAAAGTVASASRPESEEQTEKAPVAWVAPMTEPEPDSKEPAGVLAFARPPQLREHAKSTSAPVVEWEPVLAGAPELRRASVSGELGDPDPEHPSAGSAAGSAGLAPRESEAELDEEDPPLIGPSRAKIVGLLVLAGLIVMILSWMVYSNFSGLEASKQDVDAERDQSAASPHDPDAVETGGVEIVPEVGTGGMEIVPEVEPVDPVDPVAPVEPVAPKPKHSRPPKNGKPDSGTPSNGGKAPDCEGIEADARAANSAGDWKRVVKLTSRKACWKSQAERTYMRVNALSIMGRIDECIEAGAASKDPKVTAIVRLCKDVAAASQPKAP